MDPLLKFLIKKHTKLLRNNYEAVYEIIDPNISRGQKQWDLVR